MLADWLEQLTPELVARFERRGPAASLAAPARHQGDRLQTLLGALVQALRQRDVAARPTDAYADTALDMEAEVATLHLLEETVYEAIEERALPVPPGEMRLLGQWFGRRVEGVVRSECRRFATMLDAIPDHLVLTDSENHLVYANHAAAQFLSRVTGLSPAQLARSHLTEHLPDRYRAHIQSLFHRVRSGQTITEEFLFERSWREHHVTPVRDAHGKVQAVAIASRDIGKRKLAEARLQLVAKVGNLAATLDYESLLTAVARLSIPELADWCCIDVVEDGRIVRSRVAHRDPHKSALTEQLHRFSCADAGPRIAQELRAGKAFIFEPLDERLAESNPALRDLAGRLGARSAMAVPILVFGAVTAIAVFVFGAESGRRHDANDLTLAQELARRVGQLIENARLHEELRQSEARFRIALADSKIAVFEENADFDVRWAYNAGFGDGRSTDDSIAVARSSELSPELVAAKRRVLDSGEGTSAAGTIDIDGERRHLIAHYQPLRRGNEVVGITGSAIDITDEKRAQEELARAAAFRERVMAVLGHDLRNPLNMVQMQAQLLQRQPGISEQTRDDAARIVRAADRMEELIRTLLDVTWLRVGRDLRLSLEEVDLGEVAQLIVDELRVANRGRAIEVTATGELRGRWDAARIGQVVSNLVGNALTYGSLDTPVEVSLWDEGEDVALAVTNRGPTISDEALGRLFEAFWQAPSDDGERSRGGLGLGLYIVRSIVDAHGGTIDVQSRNGVTTFIARLPRSRRPALGDFDAAWTH